MATIAVYSFPLNQKFISRSNSDNASAVINIIVSLSYDLLFLSSSESSFYSLSSEFLLSTIQRPFLHHPPPSPPNLPPPGSVCAQLTHFLPPYTSSSSTTLGYSYNQGRDLHLLLLPDFTAMICSLLFNVVFLF